MRRVLELGLEVGRALAFAHAQGLVHRDVKPQNVLLNGDGRAKVTDFGIVRSLDAVGHTETGTVLGTSHYIAPEQARGERVDAQTDVYSFGVVLHELLTGEVPYAGDNFLSVAMKHVNEPVPSVLDTRPDAPIRLASLIERCLAKQPADRPASMDEVVAELEAVHAELDAKEGGEGTMIMRRPAAVPARPPRQKRRREPRDRRVPLWPLLLGLLLLAAAVGGILLATRDDDDAGRRRRAAHRCGLQGVASYDPPAGDDEEHSERVADATDGDPATYWTTESYRAFSKPGVGLVLEADGTPAALTLTTDTPGFTAEIRAGDSRDGPFDTVVGADARPPRQTTAWELDEADAPLLRRSGSPTSTGRAHVNEVEAAS